MKVFVVGQHNPIVPSEVEIVAKEMVTFATEVEEAVAQIRALADKAFAAGAEMLLLQNTPVIVSAALLEIAEIHIGICQGVGSGLGLPVKVGAIVSRQGKREGDKLSSFKVGSFDPDGLARINEGEIAAAVVAANGNAKVTFSMDGGYDVICHVQVARSSKFEFEKIVILG